MLNKLHFPIAIQLPRPLGLGQRNKNARLVEDFFRKYTKPVKRKTIIDIVRKLSRPTIQLGADLKQSHNQVQSREHGF